MYGYPSLGRGHFGTPFGHPHHLRDDFGYDGYNDYFRRQPCPTYRSLTVSPWRQSADGQIKASVALPGVNPRHRKIWLADDEGTVLIRAARAMPPQGRTCLPHGAKTSADGRFEILDRSIAFPDEADARNAMIRETRGGVDIVVPLRRMSKRMRDPAIPADSATAVQGMKQAMERKQKTEGATTVQGTRQAREQTSQADGATAVQGAQQAMERKQQPALLPFSSDGLEVVEEDWPEVAKNADAAEGWWDNRGDFHSY